MPCKRVTIEEFEALAPGSPSFPNEDACTCCEVTGDCGTCGGSWSVPIPQWYSQPPSEWNNTSPCTAVGGVFSGDSSCQFQRIKPAGGCSSLDIPPAPQYQYVTAIWSGWSEYEGGSTCCGETCVKTIDWNQWTTLINGKTFFGNNITDCTNGAGPVSYVEGFTVSLDGCSNGTYKGSVINNQSIFGMTWNNCSISKKWNFTVTVDNNGDPTGATNFVEDTSFVQQQPRCDDPDRCPGFNCVGELQPDGEPGRYTCGQMPDPQIPTITFQRT